MLKQLIQRLLDSRTTPNEAGHSAMPNSAPTTISSPTSITSWGTITTFTAPDDGYVTFHGRSMEGAAAQIASLPLENNPTVITATQDSYQGMSCNLPVVKGKTVEVYGSNIENIVVSFNRLIGGGYNLIVWRAQLCLRALSNYLPKVSFRTNLSGSAAKHIHQGVSHSQALSRNTSLPQTVFWGFTKIKRPRVIVSTFIRSDQRAKSSQEQLLHSLLPQISLLSQLSYLLRKVIVLLLVVPSQSYGSHQQWGATFNLRTGGALC